MVKVVKVAKVANVDKEGIIILKEAEAVLDKEGIDRQATDPLEIAIEVAIVIEAAEEEEEMK